MSLPRSGTQWCEQIISENLHNEPETSEIETLNEFFEPYNHTARCELSDNGYIRNDPMPDLRDLAALHRQYRGGNQLHADTAGKLDMLARARPDQPLTLRHFMRTERADVDERPLFGRLAELGFKFISLTRDYEQSVLSRIIAAVVHQAYDQNIWLMNRRPRQAQYYVDVEKFKLEALCIDRINLLLDWQHIITAKFGVDNWIFVRYENMLADLAQGLGRPLKPLKINRKTLERDPYSYIENAEEVKTIVDRYVKVYNQRKQDAATLSTK